MVDRLEAVYMEADLVSWEKQTLIKEVIALQAVAREAIRLKEVEKAKTTERIREIDEVYMTMRKVYATLAKIQADVVYQLELWGAKHGKLDETRMLRTIWDITGLALWDIELAIPSAKEPPCTDDWPF